jgi:hypothetical protein
LLTFALREINRYYGPDAKCENDEAVDIIHENILSQKAGTQDCGVFDYAIVTSEGKLTIRVVCPF